MKRMKIKKNKENKSIFTKRLLENHNSITASKKFFSCKGQFISFFPIHFLKPYYI